MWQWIIRQRLRAHSAGVPIRSTDIENARSVLFAVFARYGDSVIAFKTIAEFIARYPNKRYLLITTHQARPYAEELVQGPKQDSVQLVSINKRRNPFAMWQLTRRLRHEPPDIGFNPWSHGAESEYFVSFCRKFVLYRSFAQSERDYNLYQRARDYLQLPPPPTATPMALPTRAARAVICPFSTDIRKSLGQAGLRQLLVAVQRRFGTLDLVVAGMSEELAGAGTLVARRFVLGKTRAASEQFIALLRGAELFISVDAGPLHLAAALGVPSVGIFGPTAPETILDRDSRILPLRHPKMAGVFCDIRGCTNPVCVYQLCADLDLQRPVTVDFARRLRLETVDCAMIDHRQT